MRNWIWLLVAPWVMACAAPTPLERDFEWVGRGDSVEMAPMEIVANRAATAVFYLSPECPLCRNYTVPIKRLQREFSDRNIAFFGVVSGTYYPENQVKSYLLKYGMDLEVMMDPDFLMAEYYGAEITPEVHLLDAEGRAVYRGAIDNWAISLGQKRQKVTERYLAKAIEAHLAERPIEPAKTEAVGCYIE